MVLTGGVTGAAGGGASARWRATCTRCSASLADASRCERSRSASLSGDTGGVAGFGLAREMGAEPGRGAMGAGLTAGFAALSMRGAMGRGAFTTAAPVGAVFWNSPAIFGSSFEAPFVPMPSFSRQLRFSGSLVLS